MADDVTLNTGTGGDVIAADEIATVKYQRVKLIHGADGVNDGDVASANPLPVKVTGAAAHDAAVSGNPVLTGFRANLFEPANVGVGDAVTAWGDRFGRLVVVPAHPSPDFPDTVTLTTTTETVLKAAVIGEAIHVLLLTATNTSGTGVRLDIKDGTTVKFSFFLAASGGGFVLPLPGPGWKLANDASLRVQLSAAVTDVRVSVVCYIAVTT